MVGFFFFSFITPFFSLPEPCVKTYVVYIVIAFSKCYFYHPDLGDQGGLGVSLLALTLLAPGGVPSSGMGSGLVSGPLRAEGQPELRGDVSLGAALVHA